MTIPNKNIQKNSEKKSTFTKFIARMYRWIIISVTLQLTLFLFLDTYIFSDQSKSIDITIESSENNDALNENKVTISKDAQNIKLSYDLKYIAYKENNKLIIFNALEDEVIKEFRESDNITAYEWMDDRNTIIYNSKSSNIKNAIQINTFDFDNNFEHKMKDSITNVPSSGVVDKIQISKFVSVTYVKINIGKIARVYSFDIMGNLEYITDTTADTDFEQIKYANYLLLDSKKGSVKLRNGNSRATKELDFKEKVRLINVDKDDNVFVGAINTNGSIDKIMKGSFEKGSFKKWSDIIIPNPTKLEDIYVTNFGKVFIIDKINKQVIDIENNNKKSFDGEFVGIKNESLIVLKGEKLKITPIK